MKFAVTGVNNSEYARNCISQLYFHSYAPEYVIVEDSDPRKIAESNVFIDQGVLPRYFENSQFEHKGMLSEICSELSIPYYYVKSQNGKKPMQILSSNPIDVLIITEGPIIRGPILYAPRICVLNVHAAPLPQYRGNWTTLLSLYNDEPPTVSAHIVTPWVDEGPILKTTRYSISPGDGVEDINLKAQKAAAELIVQVVELLITNGIHVSEQPLWAGRTYKGMWNDGTLQPAMPARVLDELRNRLTKGEYGFYDN